MPRTHIDVPDAGWFRSSYSGGNETECVETAFTPFGTSVRDSKRPHDDRLQVGSAAWVAFVDSLRDGQLRV
ncbi:DUF397 domain-containing protein [Streptomyces sp. NPDC058637]|uniref:DUF397 domain-containing protein n=1 Tax=Streptomyces sp. NPDC058637 TaxID=3346569 RepID=UPI0036679BA0